MKISKICTHCNNQFFRKPSDIKRNKTGQFFCSFECFKMATKIINKVNLICKHCKKSFSVYKNTLKHLGYVLYCSRKCYNFVQSYQIEIKRCCQCNSEIRVHKGDQKEHPSGIYHCSAVCRKRTFEDSRIALRCEFCHNLIYRIRSKVKKQVFCNKKCRNKFIIGKNNPMFSKTTSTRSGYREDLEHHCRSTWEANYCRILKFLGIEYEYEPRTFDLTIGSYTPDIKIGNKFIEIKGYPRVGYIPIIAKFRKLYPNIQFILIQKSQYKSLERQYSDLINNWEFS
jgi:hypothetical protein